MIITDVTDALQNAGLAVRREFTPVMQIIVPVMPNVVLTLTGWSSPTEPAPVVQGRVYELDGDQDSEVGPFTDTDTIVSEAVSTVLNFAPVHIWEDEHLDFTNDHGVPIRVRLVDGRWGREVAFSDMRYTAQTGEHGQKISSYSPSTVLDTTAGLSLHGGFDEWSVDAGLMTVVRIWVASRPLTTVSPILD